MIYEIEIYGGKDGVGCPYCSYQIRYNRELIPRPNLCYRMYSAEKTAVNNAMKHLQKHYNKLNKKRK